MAYKIRTLQVQDEQVNAYEQILGELVTAVGRMQDARTIFVEFPQVNETAHILVTIALDKARRLLGREKE